MDSRSKMKQACTKDYFKVSDVLIIIVFLRYLLNIIFYPIFNKKYQLQAQKKRLKIYKKISNLKLNKILSLFYKIFTNKVPPELSIQVYYTLQILKMYSHTICLKKNYSKTRNSTILILTKLCFNYQIAISILFQNNLYKKILIEMYVVLKHHNTYVH